MPDGGGPLPLRLEPVVTRRYEVVVIGGGHNGLTVAAYLAKAGVDVCVVEALPYVGGGVISPEIVAPGFKTDICSIWHGLVQANPMLLDDELELVSKFGLRYLVSPHQLCVLFPDDLHLDFHCDVAQTCRSIATFSTKDAEAYALFAAAVAGPANELLRGLFEPPPPPEMFAAMFGKPGGDVLMRWLMSSARDICDEWFETDRVKAALLKFCAQAGVSPAAKGTGIVALFFIPLIHGFGGGLPQGGSGALSEAMARCIRHHGGTILTRSPVRRVIVSNGCATGVVVEGDSEIAATRAVISNLHARQIVSLVGAEALPPDFVARLGRLRRSSFGAISQAYALREAPVYRAGPEVADATFVEFAPSSVEELLQSFGDIEAGRLHTDIPAVACQTRLDPTRAPDGQHTLHLFHFAPFRPDPAPKGGWDALREEVADRVLTSLQRRTTNMGANVIGRAVETPLDLARRNPAMIDGDYNHIGMFPDQQLASRYLPGWQYRTPIERLWMCGPSCHPGGGVTGGGRAAVQPVMQALGINFAATIRHQRVPV
ncbi:phytoene dehydrogenase-like protein [Bradyrhizobium diazoefficiens]